MTRRSQYVESGVELGEPLPEQPNACACCPPKVARLDSDQLLEVGFGCVTVTRDTLVVWQGDGGLRVRDIERLAATDSVWEDRRPGDVMADWRITIDGPMNRDVYQRHGRHRWVLIEHGIGFA